MQLHQCTDFIYDASVALQLLKEGNQRFVLGYPTEKKSCESDRKILSKGQHPIAVMLCCSDSRVAPEIIFDQNLGDIFVIRNAGNVVDDVVLASIEYGVDLLLCPLVIVCGHSNCGAVNAVCKGSLHLPHLHSVAQRIQPALVNEAPADEVARCNVKNMAKQLQQALQELAAPVTVVGAFYNMVSGVVEWFDDVPQ